MAKLNGTLYNIYAAPVADLESDPQAVEDYVPAVGDYTRVKHSKSLSLGRSRASIDLSDKDTGLDPDATGGRRSGEFSLTVNFNDEGDPGQQVLNDALNSERGEVWWFVSQDKPERTEFSGRAIITDASPDFPEEAAATRSYTGMIVGPVREELAAAAV